MTLKSMQLNDDWSIKDIVNRKCIRTRFQPILSFREQMVIGLEALSYACHPLNGQHIPPGLLFDRAAKDRYSLELDRACRLSAIHSFKEMFPQGAPHLLWLNFETSILDHIEVGNGKLLDAVTRFGLSPQHVVLEIVESDVNDLTALHKFVEIYRDHGFFIALDDVGTGHSSLERIAMIKPDIIKIDRFLIRNLDREYHKFEVVRSLKNLADGIGALALAEGVETEEEALAVMDLGINLHQGFLYSHPSRPLTEQFRDCQSRIQIVAANFRKRRVEKFSIRQAYFNDISQSVSEVIANLSHCEYEDFEDILNRAVMNSPDLECIYLLSEQGIQLTETACNSGKLLRQESNFFRPASKGTDMSLKDYFLLVQAGLPRYVSDPYISRASGNLCVTLSTPFRSRDGVRYILCADYDCTSLFSR